MEPTARAELGQLTVHVGVSALHVGGVRFERIDFYPYLYIHYIYNKPFSFLVYSWAACVHIHLPGLFTLTAPARLSEGSRTYALTVLPPPSTPRTKSIFSFQDPPSLPSASLKPIPSQLPGHSLSHLSGAHPSWLIFTTNTRSLPQSVRVADPSPAEV